MLHRPLLASASGFCSPGSGNRPHGPSGFCPLRHARRMPTLAPANRARIGRAEVGDDAHADCFRGSRPARRDRHGCRRGQRARCERGPAPGGVEQYLLPGSRQAARRGAGSHRRPVLRRLSLGPGKPVVPALRAGRARLRQHAQRNQARRCHLGELHPAPGRTQYRQPWRRARSWRLRQAQYRREHLRPHERFGGVRKGVQPARARWYRCPVAAVLRPGRPPARRHHHHNDGRVRGPGRYGEDPPGLHRHHQRRFFRGGLQARRGTFQRGRLPQTATAFAHTVDNGANVYFIVVDLTGGPASKLKGVSISYTY